jgi:hypothetical protein
MPERNKSILPLVPAEAGTQSSFVPRARYWIPACAGMSGLLLQRRLRMP